MDIQLESPIQTLRIKTEGENVEEEKEVLGQVILGVEVADFVSSLNSPKVKKSIKKVPDRSIPLVLVLCLNHRFRLM